MPAAYIAALDSVALLLNEDCLSIWLVLSDGSLAGVRLPLDELFASSRLIETGEAVITLH